MKDSLNNFGEMLDTARKMFLLAMESVCGQKQGPEVKTEIYGSDQKINTDEKKIRRRIIEHMVLQPTVDTIACLVMMSVVKDAERLGDYAKNIYEISEKNTSPVSRGEYEKLFGDLDKKIDLHFQKVRKAFLESDNNMNRTLVDNGKIYLKQCSKALDEIYVSNYSADKAISLALLARFQRRIVAHLGNISSSVIMPLDKIDFFDKNAWID
ncbi:MAG: PhoU domain-containing protein [Candidatus Theseobacter exili]|nr:PhoU domain-containing protein [Candidatus Theseobacter exili]